MVILCGTYQESATETGPGLSMGNRENAKDVRVVYFFKCIFIRRLTFQMGLQQFTPTVGAYNDREWWLEKWLENGCVGWW